MVHPVQMDFEEVVDELYGLEPGEFTAARNARAQQARAAGDRALAEEIRKLRKPSVAAGLVNRMVRDEPEHVRAVVDLGESLRSAQDDLDGETLRKLAVQRRQLVTALVKKAGSGQRISDAVSRDLEQTFTAALNDAEAAEAVSTGRLTAALDPADRSAWPDSAVPKLPKAPLDEVGRRREKARAEARAAVERAEDAVYEARDRVTAAEQASAEAQTRRDEATARVEELEAELKKARETAAENKKAAEAATSELESAQRKLRGEERQLTEAQRRLEKLLR